MPSTVNKSDVSTGVLATGLARGAVVVAGRDARRSRANVRHPAAAQARTAQPFALDGRPGTTACRSRSVVGGGTRLRRVLLRWQAPQPCPAHRATGLTRPDSGALTPTSFPT